MYELKCLGQPVLVRDGTAIRFSRKKSLALLAYLAVRKQPESRDSLASLLWPEKPASSAFGYLRTTLLDIHTSCPEPIIDADRQSVCLADKAAMDVDVWRFRQLVGSGGSAPMPADRARLSEAAHLYRGRFLEGFTLKDAEPFEEWQREMSEELSRGCEDALGALIRTCVSEGDTVEALMCAQRLVAMDELDERYHRVLMSLEALAGKPVAVELAYQRCCRILKRELDAQPAEETRRLYDRVRSSRGKGPDEQLVGEIVGGLLGGTRAPAAREPATKADRAAGLAEPTAVAVDQRGRIYIVDSVARRIIRIDDMDGRNRVAFGSRGTGACQFATPAGLWIDARGRIYVADGEADRIVRFDDMDGSGWVEFGKTGSGEACFNAPTRVCTDARGRILVADCHNDRIVRIDDMDGSGWVTLANPLRAERPGELMFLRGLFVDASGWIYFAIHPATVVRINDIDGSGLATIRPANLRLHMFRRTNGLAVDPEQNVFYVAVDTFVIRIAGLSGLRWTVLEGRPGTSRSPTTQRDRLSNPFGLCLDARRRLYIAEQTNHRIVRVDDISGNGWIEYPAPEAPAG